MTVEVTIYRDQANTIIDTDFNDNVTITIQNNPGGGALTGTLTVPAVSGVAEFTDLSIDKPGEGYTLRASAAGTNLAVTSSSFTIAPNAIQFTQQPTSAIYPATLGTVEVTLFVDSGASIVDTDFNGPVAISLVSPLFTFTGSPILTGTTTVSAINGVATFSNLSLDTVVGTGFTLTANASGPLLSVNSNTFNFTGTLSFSTQPVVEQGFGLHSTVVQTAPIVAGVTVSLTLGTNPNGAILWNSGINQAPLSSISSGGGAATYAGFETVHSLYDLGTLENFSNGLAVDASGTMTLQAAALYFVTQTSNTFNVNYRPAWYNSITYITKFSALSGTTDQSNGTLSVWYKSYRSLSISDTVFDRLFPLLSFATQNGAVGTNFNTWLKCLVNSSFAGKGDNYNNHLLLTASLVNTGSTSGMNSDPQIIVLDTNWHHYLIAWKTSGTPTLKLTIDGVVDSSLTFTTFGSGFSVHYASMIPFIGAQARGTVGLGWFMHDCAMTDLYFNSQVYIDPANGANVALFRNAGTGKPVYLGDTGTGPTGSQPDIYLTMKTNEKMPSFLTNKGFGGNFSIADGNSTPQIKDNTYSFIPRLYSSDSPY